MTLGTYLIQLRGEKGYSQRDLAERCGVSAAEISRIESGKRQKPSPTLLKAMAQTLGIEYSDLMKLAGYIEEKHEEDKIYELVFKDDETGEVVDVIRGVKEMFRKDAAWANVAYRVSHELSDDDRRVLTELTLTYLKTKREEQKKAKT